MAIANVTDSTATIMLFIFQVDDNGKITRLRRECPSPDCGAGVFMASHFDRQYCGKCGLTYVFKQEKDKWMMNLFQ